MNLFEFNYVNFIFRYPIVSLKSENKIDYVQIMGFIIKPTIDKEYGCLNLDSNSKLPKQVVVAKYMNIAPTNPYKFKTVRKTHIKFKTVPDQSIRN